MLRHPSHLRRVSSAARCSSQHVWTTTAHYSTTRSKSTQTSSRSSSPDADSADTAATQRIPVVKRTPVVPYPLSPRKPVPSHISQPPYASIGMVYPPEFDDILLHDETSVAKMRDAARLARRTLDRACALATQYKPGTTTDDIDTEIHNALIAAGAYPSPLNYAGFPKSMCSSVNEVICHGIPDTRPLRFGDVVSFDVSCFLNGVHGDNCATVIVGDCPDDNDGEGYDAATSAASSDDEDCDWRGVPYRTTFATDACRAHFSQARRLVRATRECLYQAIATVQPGSCLSEIGAACQDVAERYGYESVQKYRGHGISSDFHTKPFVKHYRNDDVCELKPGMIFTIEPMLVTGSQACFEWEHDHWTVATRDGSLAAQFEHTVLVTETGVEILTLPD